ncbi:hypothetical protein IJT10_06255, partial [bacterium]|nr:hypothetical protein [bacterium]
MRTGSKNIPFSEEILARTLNDMTKSDSQFMTENANIRRKARLFLRILNVLAAVYFIYVLYRG